LYEYCDSNSKFEEAKTDQICKISNHESMTANHLYREEHTEIIVPKMLYDHVRAFIEVLKVRKKRKKNEQKLALWAIWRCWPEYFDIRNMTASIMEFQNSATKCACCSQIVPKFWRSVLKLYMDLCILGDIRLLNMRTEETTEE